MKKAIAFLLFIILLFPIFSCSCALFRGFLDEKSGISGHLKETENSIRREDWPSAAENLQDSKQAWKQIKPILQIDIDHDYVNDIENDFVRLSAYIESKEKAESLSTILLLQKNWLNIGEM